MIPHRYTYVRAVLFFTMYVVSRVLCECVCARIIGVLFSLKDIDYIAVEAHMFAFVWLYLTPRVMLLVIVIFISLYLFSPILKEPTW